MMNFVKNKNKVFIIFFAEYTYVNLKIIKETLTCRKMNTLILFTHALYLIMTSIFTIIWGISRTLVCFFQPIWNPSPSDQEK